jgi:phospholipase C
MPMTPDELKANVDTIVVVMMENRSFDHVLGHLRHPDFGNRKEIDGIEDLNNLTYLNPNTDGEGVAPFWMKDHPLDSDLPHDPEAIVTQLRLDAFGVYRMNGFVQAFEDEFHTSVTDPPVMGLLTTTGVPATGALAAKYTVCNRWFACIPTSTAPNRLMSMCGYSNIRDTSIVVPNQDTVYEWLLQRGIPWRVYSAGLPFLTLMPKLAPLLLTSHFRRLNQLADDIEHEPVSDWPKVIFIEPDYYDSPIHPQAPCDNHPPLAMAPGEAFLADIYSLLSQDEERWARTVLIVTYDEHGGFFDHVPVLPVKYRNPNGVSFDSTGPRVPAIVAGAFAPRGVSNALLDNTSILQLVAERFGKPGETYSPEVAGRMKQKIESVSAVLSLAAKKPSLADLSAVTSHAVPAPPPNATVADKLRDAFDRAARDLAARHGAEAFAKYPELRAYVESPPGAGVVAAAPVALAAAPRPGKRTKPKRASKARGPKRGKRRKRP